MPSVRRHLVVVCVLLSYLAAQVMGSQLVLCVGTDGHVAVEIEHDCCAPGAAPTDRNIEPPCCTDMAVQALPATHRAEAAADGLKLNTPVCIAVLCDARLPLLSRSASPDRTAPPDARGLRALRSVILIV